MSFTGPGVKADPNWELRHKAQTGYTHSWQQLQLTPSTGPQESPPPSPRRDRRSRGTFQEQPGQGRGCWGHSHGCRSCTDALNTHEFPGKVRRDSRCRRRSFQSSLSIFVEQNKRLQHNYRHLTSHRSKLPIPSYSSIQTKTATKHLKALIMFF